MTESIAGDTGRAADPINLIMTLPSSDFLHSLTLTGHLGTLCVLVAWYSWLAPSEYFPVSLVLLVLVLPLFAPLRGMLHRRRYTIAWSCFLALIYFTHGVVEAYVSESTRHLGLLEVVFSSLWFLAAMAYVRVTAARS